MIEKTMSYDEFQTADEIFSTGNYSKLSPVTRIDDRELQPGPVYHQARALYLDSRRIPARERDTADLKVASTKKAGPAESRFQTHRGDPSMPLFHGRFVHLWLM